MVGYNGVIKVGGYSLGKVLGGVGLVNFFVGVVNYFLVEYKEVFKFLFLEDLFFLF